MAATQIGTTLIVGGQSTLFSSYIVESQGTNTVDADEEMVNDADGKPVTKIIYSALPVVTLNLICMSGANPATDFPAKGRCAVTGTYSGWFVDSAEVSTSKSPQRVTERLISLGF